MKELTQGLPGLGPRRKSAGFTQERFAEALGVTRSLLAAWEVGVTWPSSRWLPKMAELLGCEVDDLYRAVPNAEFGIRNAELGERITTRQEPRSGAVACCTPSAEGVPQPTCATVRNDTAAEGGGSDGAEVC